MENSRWKLNKERGEHLLVAGFFLAILGFVLGALKGDMFDYIGLAVGASGCWVLFWVLRGGKFITPPKWVLHLFLWVNVSISALVIVVTVGTLFFQW